MRQTFSRCPRAPSDTNPYCQPTKNTKIAEDQLYRRHRIRRDRHAIAGYDRVQEIAKSYGLTQPPQPTFPRCADTFWPPTTYDRISFASFRAEQICYNVNNQVSRYPHIKYISLQILGRSIIIMIPIYCLRAIF